MFCLRSSAGFASSAAVLHELEARGRDLALDRGGVDAVQRRRVAPARARLGVVIDDEIDAAGLQRREDLAVHVGRVDAVAREVVIELHHQHGVDVRRQLHLVVVRLRVGRVRVRRVERARGLAAEPVRPRHVDHVDLARRADGLDEHVRPVVAERRELDDALAFRQVQRASTSRRACGRRRARAARRGEPATRRRA